MEIFNLTELSDQRDQEGKPYLEFIRKTSLSVGLYELVEGAEDQQTPHTEDEVYFVVSGKAQFVCEGISSPVESGSVIFVRKGDDHRFHSITEDLSILVFFAPAEYSNRS